MGTKLFSISLKRLETCNYFLLESRVYCEVLPRIDYYLLGPIPFPSSPTPSASPSPTNSFHEETPISDTRAYNSEGSAAQTS